jgi:hypothetical protein
MAKRRKGGRRKFRAGGCKVVSVCGRRRRLCWNKKGKIRSNKPA